MPVVTLSALFCAAVLLASQRPADSVRLTGNRRLVALSIAVPVLGVALVGHVGNRATAASSAAIERGEPHSALAHAQRAIDWAPWSHEPCQLRGEAELFVQDDVAARKSLAHALKLNPENWSTWLDLAVASRGAERVRALAEAKRLQPRALRSPSFKPSSKQNLNNLQRMSRAAHQPAENDDVRKVERSPVEQSTEVPRIAAAVALTVCTVVALSALGESVLRRTEVAPASTSTARR
jgi:hypothetical protein